MDSSGAKACTLTLGYCDTCLDHGTVSVNNGRLDITNEAWVGFHATGALNIINGGTVTTGSLVMAAFVQATSTGTVSVKGATTLCKIYGGAYVGGQAGSPGGMALMEVEDGGTVNAGNIYVWGSGTLAGNGTVTTTNGTTVDGTLEPSGGTLSITGNGNLTLHSSATMLSNVVPASADNVNVSASGGAFLNGRLAVTMTGTFTPGTTYTLLTANPGGLHNTTFFSVSINFPAGQNFSPQIIYDTNHVKLYLAPNTGP